MGTRLVSCYVILEVAGLEMAEPADVGEFDVFDFSDESMDHLVQVNDFQLRVGKGAEQLKDVF